MAAHTMQRSSVLSAGKVVPLQRCVAWLRQDGYWEADRVASDTARGSFGQISGIE